MGPWMYLTGSLCDLMSVMGLGAVGNDRALKCDGIFIVVVVAPWW